MMMIVIGGICLIRNEMEGWMLMVMGIVIY
jgi:hypothetical protein